MSRDQVITIPASNEVEEDIKVSQPNASKLHRVLLTHMIKNSKQVENSETKK